MSMEKMIKKYRKAKGFTLVELLIVIVIIGILAGMLMLSTGGATDSATATKIVSDMRNIKAGSVMYFLDEKVWPTSINSSFDKYMDVPLSTQTNPSKGGFEIKSGTGGTGTDKPLWIEYKDSNVLTGGVKAKLKNMAGDVGLYASAATTVPASPDYAGGDSVYMLIRH